MPSKFQRTFGEFFGQQTPTQQTAMAALTNPKGRFGVSEGAFFQPEKFHAIPQMGQLWGDVTRGVIGAGAPHVVSGEWNPTSDTQQRTTVTTLPDGRQIVQPAMGPGGAPSRPIPVYKPDTPEQLEGRRLVNQIRQEQLKIKKAVAEGTATREQLVSLALHGSQLAQSIDPTDAETGRNIQLWANEHLKNIGIGGQGPAAQVLPQGKPGYPAWKQPRTSGKTVDPYTGN